MDANLGSVINTQLNGSSEVGAVQSGFGSEIDAELGMQIASQLAQNSVDNNSSLSAQEKTILKESIVDSLGEGLPGNPGTNDGFAEFVSDEVGIDLGETQAQVDDMDIAMDNLIMSFLEDEEKEEGGSAAGGSGSSWIMIMADKLGKVLDGKFEEMQFHVDKVAGLGEQSLAKDANGEPTSEADVASASMPSSTALMQGKMQEFTMVMNAVNNAIKTSGQAGASMANKN